MKKYLIGLLCWICALVGAKEVSLAKMFTDNMVLQQGKPVPVWGWGPDGAEVKVSCNGETAVATVVEGKWMVTLPAMDYNAACELVVESGGQTNRLTNVAVGEVWIAAGQSNMDWALKKTDNGKQAVQNSANPNLRLLKVATNMQPVEPQAEFATLMGWDLAGPESTEKFSAVGYYFGREIQQNQNVVVGIISSSVGGTAAEMWISEENCPEFEGRKRKRDGLIKGAAFHYNAMIRPMIPYAVRGVIWYQGESNVNAGLGYEQILTSLINDWRGAWEDEYHFLIVQLANFKARNESPFDGPWAYLREAQANVATLPNTGLATAMGLGNPDNIHPTNKLDVAKRLALVAEAKAYGAADVVYSGPVFREQKVQGDKLILHFDHVGSGLEAEGNTLEGFAIAGEDQQWEVAEATIEGDTVVLSIAGKTAPVYVRYAFANNPVLSLYNAEGLPALPFRTDTFDLVR